MSPLWALLVWRGHDRLRLAAFIDKRLSLFVVCAKSFHKCLGGGGSTAWLAGVIERMTISAILCTEDLFLDLPDPEVFCTAPGENMVEIAVVCLCEESGGMVTLAGCFLCGVLLRRMLLAT